MIERRRRSAPAESRIRRALAVTIFVLALANVAREVVVPDGLHLWFNVALGVIVLGIAAWARLSADDLGLARRHLGAGIRLGLITFAVVAVAVAIAASIPALGNLFEDDRAGVAGGRLGWELLVEIPLGTVLVEELAFRGVLLAELRRVSTTMAAVLWSSVLFGVWHIAPAWSSASSNDAISDVGDSAIVRAAAVLGTLAVTTAAGVGFCWLRTRSRSLAAPILAHYATNATAFAAAWTLTR